MTSPAGAMSTNTGSAALIRLTASVFATSIFCLMSSLATAITLQSLWGSRVIKIQKLKFKMTAQNLMISLKVVAPVETGVQRICSYLKKLDSGSPLPAFAGTSFAGTSFAGMTENRIFRFLTNSSNLKGGNSWILISGFNLPFD
jgi:hypothetical protein